MALFVKKTDEKNEVAQMYTFGMGKNRVFVGLGNIGDEYKDNRHNAGFMALDALSDSTGIDSWIHKKDLKCHLAIGDMAGTRVILVKPDTFMNNSGQAMQAVLNFYKVDTQDTVVVYDEVDLDLGKIQIKQGGGAAGHNGLKSVLAHNEDSFTRIRIGVGPKAPEQIDLADFVLQDFSKDQQPTIKLAAQEAASLLGESTASKLAPETRSVLV